MQPQNFKTVAELSDFLNTRGIDALIKLYTSAITQIATRLWQPVFEQFSGIEVDDFVTAGQLELANLTKSWDPQRGETFRSHVLGRVRYRMLDLLRENSRLSRLYMGRYTEISAASEKLFLRLGREPTQDELMDELAWKREKFIETISQVNFSSWNQMTKTARGEEHFDPGDNYSEARVSLHAGSIPADAEFKRVESFKRLLRLLPQYWDKVAFYLYCCLNFTMKEAAECMNISESRCSQAMSSYLRLLAGDNSLKEFHLVATELNAGRLQEVCCREWELLSERGRHEVVNTFNLSTYFPNHGLPKQNLADQLYDRESYVDFEPVNSLGIPSATISDQNTLLLMFEVDPKR